MAPRSRKEVVDPRIDAWLGYLASRNVRSGFQPYYAAALDADRVLAGIAEEGFAIKGCLGGGLRVTFRYEEAKDLLQRRAAGPYVRLLHVGLVYGLGMKREPERVIQRTQGESLELELPTRYKLTFVQRDQAYRLTGIECRSARDEEIYPPDHATLPSEFDRVRRWVRHIRGATGATWAVDRPAGAIDKDLVASIVSPRGLVIADVNSTKGKRRYSADAVRIGLLKESDEIYTRFLHVGFVVGEYLESSSLASSIAYDVSPTGLVLEVQGDYRLEFEGHGEKAHLIGIEYVRRAGH